jgi:hypothetical protein
VFELLIMCDNIYNPFWEGYLTRGEKNHALFCGGLCYVTDSVGLG